MLKQILDVGPHHNKIVGVLFAYLFRNIGKYEFRKALPTKELAKHVWSKAETNGYIQKHCKLYAYAVHCNRALGQATSPAKYGISQDDVAILRRVNLSHIPTAHRAYTLLEFDRLEARILLNPEIREYIGRFISKKLLFLCKSYGLKRMDIENELIEAAMFGLRKQYPFYESELHATNICKTSIHNRGMGLIEYWTRKKRNALIKENGGFQAVHVQYELMPDIGVLPLHDDPRFQNLQALVVVATTKLKPRALTFVEAAAGKYSAGFSMFLGMDNVEAACAWDYNRYMGSLREYFKVSETQTDKLFAHLRQNMR